MGTKIHKWMVLGTLSLGLGMSTPCLGYVMVRSGFGDFKGEVIKQVISPVNRVAGNNYTRMWRDQPDCTEGRFDYVSQHNLSVALGRRFNIFNIGALGLEVEILGAYVKGGDGKRGPANVEGVTLVEPDFIIDIERYLAANLWVRQHRCHYFKNQRIAGTQVNLYWEQYLLDWLSVGIGGGIGGAYVCTKFTVVQWFDHINPGLVANSWASFANARKYVHSGSLLYNFTLFVRAEQFETLFEVGYRHIGLHQMFGAKCYGYTIPKLANLHSDQVYVGVGRTF